MAFALAPGIHFDNGANHQHAGARGAHPAAEQGAEQQKAHIDAGRTRQIALQRNVAGYAEQAEQQYNKSKIIVYDAFQHHLGGVVCAEAYHKRNNERQRPCKHHRGLMFLPPGGLYQRKQRDAKQDPCKGNAIQQRGHSRAGFPRRRFGHGCNRKGQHAQKGSGQGRQFFHNAIPPKSLSAGKQQGGPNGPQRGEPRP